MDRLRYDNVLALALLVCMCAQVFGQLCEKQCQCPGPAPQCPAGIPLLLDGCQCCQVCARQKGEPCSDMLPCDRQQGLRCDDSASFPGDPGECVSQEDMDCELNGVTYHDGQTFQLSCHAQCHCRAGGVTCVPLCPLTALMPSKDCPNPQHVLLPGKCCKEWVCENLENTILQDAITASRPDRLWPVVPAGSGPGGPHHPNQLLPYAPQAAAHVCVDQSTEWSACSRSCGAGVSTRVSNQNAGCRLEMQSRLCKVRPCQALQPRTTPLWGQRGRCEASYRLPVPVRLVHQGCFSSRVYRPRYCGQCTDARCCTPYRTHTAQVAFRCPSGRVMRRAVMMIHSCACHYNCPYSAGPAYGRPGLWG